MTDVAVTAGDSEEPDANEGLGVDGMTGAGAFPPEQAPTDMAIAIVTAIERQIVYEAVFEIMSKATLDPPLCNAKEPDAAAMAQFATLIS